MNLKTHTFDNLFSISNRFSFTESIHWNTDLNRPFLTIKTESGITSIHINHTINILKSIKYTNYCLDSISNHIRKHKSCFEGIQFDSPNKSYHFKHTFYMVNHIVNISDSRDKNIPYIKYKSNLKDIVCIMKDNPYIS